ncbi:MAG: proline dehydrogenase family protein [Gemmatimonadetes bacterium]|nr:proline dehydrogenase family protein [Gemmatimonadota bacterium]
MLRESLLFLSESPAAKRLITRTPLSRRIAERFVAGESLDDAIKAARAMNELGLKVSLDYLGESVTNRAEAEEAGRVAIATLERIAAEGLDANISVKPSALGLGIDEEFCRENLERVLSRARELGNGEGEIFVRLDMEASEYTERTIKLVESLWENGYRNVGTVLQSYLKRTPRDLDRLVGKGMRIRLVKGAYNEPDEVAFPEKAEVDRQYLDETKTLLHAGCYPAIATHDQAIIAETRRYAFEQGISRESFEFQMLYGIRRDLQQRLREDGYNVRVYIPFGGSWYPYLMRRMAERPANLLFVTSSIVRESPIPRLASPFALGAGMLAGSFFGFAWRKRRNHSR